MMKKCQKINLSKPECNCTGTGNIFNLIMRMTVQFHNVEYYCEFHIRLSHVFCLYFLSYLSRNNCLFQSCWYFFFTGQGGSVIELPLGVRKIVGSNPGRDIPKVLKIWYQQFRCLRLALKGECSETLLVGPVTAYNVTSDKASILGIILSMKKCYHSSQ